MSTETTHRYSPEAVLAQRGITANTVLDRAMWLAGVKKDLELARLMGVTKSAISTWRRRNHIPYEELLVLQFEKDIDFIYCIFGRSVHELADAKVAQELDSAAERDKFYASILRGLDILRKRSGEREGPQ